MPSEEDRLLQEDIMKRSGEHEAPDAQRMTEAAQALHQLKQLGHAKNPHAMKMVMDAERTGEPLFCFRARDFFSVQVISHYAEIVEKYGPDDSAFHNNIVDALGEFKEWQKANVSKVRYPD